MTKENNFDNIHNYDTKKKTMKTILNWIGFQPATIRQIILYLKSKIFSFLLMSGNS